MGAMNLMNTIDILFLNFFCCRFFFFFLNASNNEVYNFGMRLWSCNNCEWNWIKIPNKTSTYLTLNNNLAQITWIERIKLYEQWWTWDELQEHICIIYRLKKDWRKETMGNQRNKFWPNTRLWQNCTIQIEQTKFRGLGLPKNAEHDEWTQPYFQP